MATFEFKNEQKPIKKTQKHNKKTSKNILLTYKSLQFFLLYNVRVEFISYELNPELMNLTLKFILYELNPDITNLIESIFSLAIYKLIGLLRNIWSIVTKIYKNYNSYILYTQFNL